MKKRSISVVAGLAGLCLAMTGCGTSEEPAAADPTPTESGVAEAPSGPITITDARGKTITFEEPATRVGGTEWNVVEYAASLGVEPVAVSDIKGFKTWDSAVELSSDVTDIGTRGEPSLDTLAGLGLDVLFVTDSLVGDAVKQIEKQIPVVVVPGGDPADPVGSMWSNLDLVAQVTGTEEEAAALKASYDAKIAETSDAIAAAGLEGAPVAFSDAYEASGSISVRPYGEGSLLGGVLAEIGLGNAWSEIPGLETDPIYGLATTDVEGLTQLSEDTLFWYIGTDDAEDIYSVTLKDDPIWTGLSFVKAGHVHRLPDRIWMFGGPASMMQFLDGVQAAVAS